MRTPIVAATAVVVVLVALTGCTRQQGPFDGVAQAVCEKKVGPAIVAWWRDGYGDTPWTVVDTHTSTIEDGPGRSDEVTAVTVTGESSVQREEHGTASERVAWSCSAQTTADDPSTMSATIREITLG